MTGTDEGDEGDADRARFAEVSEELRHALLASFPGWLTERIRSRIETHPPEGGPPPQEELAEVTARCTEGLDVELTLLLGADIDEQRLTPLQAIRRSLEPATRWLAGQGASPARRDEVATRAAPNDLFDLAPGSLHELSDETGAAAVAWGAAKAWMHRRRHLPTSRE